MSWNTVELLSFGMQLEDVSESIRMLLDTPYRESNSEDLLQDFSWSNKR